MGFKGLLLTGGRIGVKECIVNKLIQLNSEYRSFPIQQEIIVFAVIFVRAFLGSFLNTVIIAYDQNSILNSIYQIYNILLKFITFHGDANRLMMVLLIVVIFGVLLSCLLFILSPYVLTRYAGFVLITLHHYLLPILIRYLIKMFINLQHDPNFVLVQIFVIASFVLILILETLFWIMGSTPGEKNENFLSVNRRESIEVSEILLYGLLICLSVASEGNELSRELKMTFLVIQSLLTLVSIYSIQTSFYYHNESAECAYRFFCSFEFIVSIMTFIVIVADDTLISDNMEFMALALTSLLYWSCQSSIDYEHRELILANRPDFEDDERLKNYTHGLSKAAVFNKEKNNKRDFIISTLKIKHQEICTSVACICKSVKENDLPNKLEKFLLQSEIKIILENSKNIEIVLSACFLNLGQFSSFTDLLWVVNKIESQKKFSFFQRFEVLCLREKIKKFLENKRISFRAISTETIEKQDSLIVLFGERMHSIASEKSTFWLNLSKRTPDFEIIDNSIRHQIRLTSEIEEWIPFLLKNYQFSKIIMSLVSLYEICIKMKSQISKNVIKIFKDFPLIESEKIKMLKNQKFKMERVLFENEAVIFESKIDRENMGTIFNVSKNVSNVFGHQKSTVIGKNINIIMPKSMQKEHDIILQSWRLRCSWANINKMRYIFAVTKTNICFESIIYLRIVQREDSVNLLATFIKGNENDYMIINEEGTIDGIGSNFSQYVGSKVAKFPFKMICSDAQVVIDETNKDRSGRTSLNFYHPDELENNIEEYFNNKHTLNSNFCSDQDVFTHVNSELELPNAEVPKHKRLTEINVEYRPYKMGNKSFIILKFLDIHSSIKNKILEEDVQKERVNQNDPINVESESFLRNFEQNNGGKHNNVPSFDASQTSSARESEKLFVFLEEKFQKSGKIWSSFLRYYFLGILGIISISVIFIAIHYIMIEGINGSMEVEIAGSLRFMRKAEGLILVESRMHNIYQMSEKDFELNRIFVELDRIGLNIQRESVKNWAKFYKQQPPLTKSMEVFEYNKKMSILFDSFYSQYLMEAIKMRDEINMGKSENTSASMLKNENQESMKQYLEQCFSILQNNVIKDLKEKSVYSILKLLFLSFGILVFFVLIWKSKHFEFAQKIYIKKILLSINEFNCQECLLYFQHISSILRKAVSDKSNQNSAKNIEMRIVTKKLLLSAFETFEPEKDKFEHRKVVEEEGFKFTKFYGVILLLSMLMFIPVITVFINENTQNDHEKTFANLYFSFINAEKEMSYDFLALKTLIETDDISDDKFQQIRERVEERKKLKIESILNTVFLNLLGKISLIGINNSQSLSFMMEEKGSLCKKIKDIDEDFYNHVCIEKSTFSFNRLGYFESNSIIEEYITNILSMIIAGETNSEIFKQVYTLEQVLTLKIIYRNKLLDEIEKWGVNLRKNHMNKLRQTMIVLEVLILLVIVFSWCYELRICENVRRNGWNILVIPEIVLRNTKGAMRHIENVLVAFN